MGDRIELDPEVERTLAQLRSYAEETGRSLAGVLTEAVADYLSRARLRPEFRAAADEVLEDHAELLDRLAR
ncbi:MAG: DNA-binding protein [Planctomycetota bacterium]